MSISSSSSSEIDQVTRTTQIIIGALIAGVTTFVLITVFLIHFAGFSLTGSPATPTPAPVPAAPGQTAAPSAPGAGKPAHNPAAAQQAPQTIPVLTYASVAVGLALLPLSFILPGFVATQNLRAAAKPKRDGTQGSASTSSPQGKLTPAMAYQASAILGGALDEGPAFFATVAYLIEQNALALVVVGVCLAALLLRFPTRDRVERWIALQEEKLRAEG
jgi:hypothetical protein